MELDFHSQYFYYSQKQLGCIIRLYFITETHNFPEERFINRRNRWPCPWKRMIIRCQVSTHEEVFDFHWSTAVHQHTNNFFPMLGCFNGGTLKKLQSWSQWINWSSETKAYALLHYCTAELKWLPRPFENNLGIWGLTIISKLCPPFWEVLPQKAWWTICSRLQISEGGDLSGHRCNPHASLH